MFRRKPAWLLAFYRFETLKHLFLKIMKIERLGRLERYTLSSKLPNSPNSRKVTRAQMFQEVQMNESRIERHLVEGVKRLGGMCVKFVSPGTPGVPDRLIITATGRIIFAELKTETGRLAKIQRYTIGEMQKRGADVRVVKGLDEVKALLAEIGGMQDGV